MTKRLLFVAALVVIPWGAAAQTPTSDLGPSATNVLGPGGGSSTGDSSALQPAGNTPLQSTTDDGAGLTAPNGNTLQAPATDEATLRVLMNEADGEHHELESGEAATDIWSWVGLGLGLAFLMTASLVIARDRHRFRKD